MVADWQAMITRRAAGARPPVFAPDGQSVVQRITGVTAGKYR
ncbi:MAG: hypothetical protein E6560_15210 [Yersiniaceae bacterium]|nr:hypothetical protein [Yersiniaceae bacterium]